MGTMNREVWRMASPTETLQLFHNLAHDENKFQDCLNHLIHEKEDLEFFFEYIWTYRSEPSAKEILNHSLFPAELLLKFIYLGFGKKILEGEFLGFFSQISELLSPDACLKVLQLKEEISRDPSLRIHLIAALNPNTWEKYFETLAGESFSISSIISIFENLDSDQVQVILFQNPILGSYLQSLILYADRAKDDQITSLELQIVTYLELIEAWQKFVDKLKKTFDLTQERTKLQKERDPGRLKQILYRILDLAEANRHNFLVFLKASGVIFDDWELSLLKDGYTNFLKQGSVF